MGIFDSISDTVSDAADTVSDTVGGAVDRVTGGGSSGGSSSNVSRQSGSSSRDTSGSLSDSGPVDLGGGSSGGSSGGGRSSSRRSSSRRSSRPTTRTITETVSNVGSDIGETVNETVSSGRSVVSSSVESGVDRARDITTGGISSGIEAVSNIGSDGDSGGSGGSGGGSELGGSPPPAITRPTSSPGASQNQQVDINDLSRDDVEIGDRPETPEDIKTISPVDRARARKQAASEVDILSPDDFAVTGVVDTDDGRRFEVSGPDVTADIEPDQQQADPFNRDSALAIAARGGFETNNNPSPPLATTSQSGGTESITGLGLSDPLEAANQPSGLVDRVQQPLDDISNTIQPTLRGTGDLVGQGVATASLAPAVEEAFFGTRRTETAIRGGAQEVASGLDPAGAASGVIDVGRFTFGNREISATNPGLGSTEFALSGQE